MRGKDPTMEQPRLLLVTEDDVWGDTVGRAFVLKGYQVTRAHSAASAMKEGARSRPDAVLMGLDRSEGASAELCRSVRGASWVDDTTPIVVTTVAELPAEQRLALLRAGAWDLVPSSAQADEVATRVEHYLAARRLAERARQEGLVDPATGLYNDHGLARRAEELVAEAFRRHAALACLAVAPDLPGDGVADTEAAALSLAEALHGIRRSDVSGREAPAEFVILAPRTDALGAVGLARRLRNAVRAMYLRVGYDAVPNVREAPSTSPKNLIQAALEALRRIPSGSRERPIQPFRPFEHRPPTRS
jgi:DNA-binding response OmpR family regulator